MKKNVLLNLLNWTIASSATLASEFSAEPILFNSLLGSTFKRVAIQLQSKYKYGTFISDGKIISDGNIDLSDNKLVNAKVQYGYVGAAPTQIYANSDGLLVGTIGASPSGTTISLVIPTGALYIDITLLGAHVGIGAAVIGAVGIQLEK